MDVQILIGDVLEHPADVLVSTANPWLNMSGGVNGAILERGGEWIQEELREHLRSIGKSAVPAGSVICTSAGPLPFRNILHAVAIDPFYDSSVELVQETLEAAFQMAGTLDANTLSMPTLATGYGRLPLASFAQAFAHLVTRDWTPLTSARLVVRTEENAKLISRAMRRYEPKK